MTENHFRREEVRGLFTLGLMAVLVSFRFTLSPEIEYFLILPFAFHRVVYSPFVIIDSILMLWGVYAFFMILGFSNDIFAPTLCNLFRQVGTLFMLISIVIVGIFAWAFVYTSYFPVSMTAVYVCAIMLIAVFFAKLIWKWRQKICQFLHQIRSRFLYSGKTSLQLRIPKSYRAHSSIKSVSA